MRSNSASGPASSSARLPGALGGLLHALATVTFNVDHIVSGVAITILSLGLARYLASFTFAKMPGGGVTQSPSVPALPRWSVPGVSAFEGLEQRHWFLISDVAGILRGLFTDVSALTVIAVAPGAGDLLPTLAHRVRAAAALLRRKPARGRVLGVNVYRYKYYRAW